MLTPGAAQSSLGCFDYLLPPDCQTDVCVERGTAGDFLQTQAHARQFLDEAPEETGKDRLRAGSSSAAANTGERVDSDKDRSCLLSEVQNSEGHLHDMATHAAGVRSGEERPSNRPALLQYSLAVAEGTTQPDAPVVRASSLWAAIAAEENSFWCIPGCGIVRLKRTSGEDCGDLKKRSEEKGQVSLAMVVSRSRRRTEKAAPSSSEARTRKTERQAEGSSVSPTLARLAACPDEPLRTGRDEKAKRIDYQRPTKRPLLHIRLCTLWISFDLVMPHERERRSSGASAGEGGHSSAPGLTLFRRKEVDLAAAEEFLTLKGFREEHHREPDQRDHVRTSQGSEELQPGDATVCEALQGEVVYKVQQDVGRGEKSPIGREKNELKEEERTANLTEEEAREENEKTGNSSDGTEATKRRDSKETLLAQAKRSPGKRSRPQGGENEEGNASDVVTARDPWSTSRSLPEASPQGQVAEGFGDDMQNGDAASWRKKKRRTTSGHMRDQAGTRRASTAGDRDPDQPDAKQEGDKPSPTARCKCKGPQEEKDGDSFAEQGSQKPAGEVSQQANPASSYADSPGEEEDVEPTSLGEEAKGDCCIDEGSLSQLASSPGASGHRDELDTAAQQKSQNDRLRIKDEARVPDDCEAEERLKPRRESKDLSSRPEHEDKDALASRFALRTGRQEEKAQEGRRGIWQGSPAGHTRCDQAVDLSRWLGGDVSSPQAEKLDGFSSVVSWGLEWFCSSATPPLLRVSDGVPRDDRARYRRSGDCGAADCQAGGDEEALLPAAVTHRENSSSGLNITERREQTVPPNRQQPGAERSIEVVVTSSFSTLRPPFTAGGREAKRQTQRTASDLHDSQVRLPGNLDVDQFVTDIRSKISPGIGRRVDRPDRLLLWRTSFLSGRDRDAGPGSLAAPGWHVLPGERSPDVQTVGVSVPLSAARRWRETGTREEARLLTGFDDLKCYGLSPRDYVGLVGKAQRRRTLFRYGMRTLAKAMAELAQIPSSAGGVEEDENDSAAGGQTGRRQALFMRMVGPLLWQVTGSGCLHHYQLQPSHVVRYRLPCSADVWFFSCIQFSSAPFSRQCCV